jgi:hypothetical protein
LTLQNRRPDRLPLSGLFIVTLVDNRPGSVRAVLRLFMAVAQCLNPVNGWQEL